MTSWQGTGPLRELPALRHVLTFADLAALEAEGRAHAEESPSALDEASAAIDEEDLYTIIYTSGTTGPPKGCMLSHRNYYAMAAVSDRMESHYRADDTMLLYLPLAHNFGRLMLLSGAYIGFTIAFLADPLRVAAALPRPPHDPPERAPRVREGAHGGAGPLRRGDRRQAPARRLGAPIGREVSRLEGEGKPVLATPAPATDSPTASSSRRSASASAIAQHPDPARRSRARSPTSSTRSGYASSRATG